jgi:hypothetical protein
MARTMEALRDFRAIATSVGAKRIVAVATAAMRDASNGGLFARRVERELGIRIETIECGADHLPRLQSGSQHQYPELFVEHATLFLNT